MEKFELNIYDDNDKVVKTCKANIVDLTMGNVRDLMELFNVEEINDTSELLRKVYKAWKNVTRILGKVFPEVNDEDWDNVKLSELLPMLVYILKDSLKQLFLMFGADSKNEKGA